MALLSWTQHSISSVRSRGCTKGTDYAYWDCRDLLVIVAVRFDILPHRFHCSGLTVCQTKHFGVC
jgi:hypothetical protein